MGTKPRSKPPNLDDEYTPNAAAAARARDRARLARDREQAARREAAQRQAEIAQARTQAEPIDAAALSGAVADLAANWGLKQRRARRR